MKANGSLKVIIRSCQVCGRTLQMQVFTKVKVKIKFQDSLNKAAMDIMYTYIAEQNCITAEDIRVKVWL